LEGDAPLITEKTISEFIKFHESEKNDLSFISFELQDPTGYGRIIRDELGVKEIIEEKMQRMKLKKLKK